MELEQEDPWGDQGQNRALNTHPPAYFYRQGIESKPFTYVKGFLG